MNKQGWPDQLLNKLQYKNACVSGAGGAGWWAIRGILFPYIADRGFFDNVKLLIYVHTFRERLFTRDSNMFAARPQNIPDYFSHKELDDKTLAASLYYKYIYDSQFHEWAQTQWFAEYKDLVKNVPMVINLFFSGHQPCYQLPGVCVKTGLFELALRQHEDIDLLCRDGTLGYLNHFLPENNKIFADQLYKIICGQALDFDKDEFKKDNS